MRWLAMPVVSTLAMALLHVAATSMVECYGVVSANVAGNPNQAIVSTVYFPYRIGFLLRQYRFVHERNL